MSETSPFHDGERAVQSRVGVRDKIEEIGQRLIRDFMPDQHREFFAQLAFLVVGAVDDEGRPWASALTGEPGFLDSPDDRHLHVAARPRAGDPFAAALHEGAAIGALGIELHTRRRNRLNGKAALDSNGDGLTISVDQSFGNCPQYIQIRELDPDAARPAPSEPTIARATRFDTAAKTILATADTFFIASSFGGDSGKRNHGVDVSHRGGRAGFAAARDDHTLEWPDYRGNFLFNTLGNLTANPRCGLLFIDFTSGDILQLTGRAEILWSFDETDPNFANAERALRFHLDEAVLSASAFPLRGPRLEYAPQLEAR